MIGIELPIATIQAALLFAGKKDVRETINSVHIEVRATETRLIATNGAAAIIIRDTSITALGDADFTVPRRLLDTLKGKNRATIRYLPDHDGALAEIEVSSGGVTYRGRELENFPDIYRVVPTSPDGTLCTSGVTAQYDPEYLVRAVKAASLLTGVKNAIPHIRYNGGRKAAVVGCAGCVNMCVLVSAIDERYSKAPELDWAAQKAV